MKKHTTAVVLVLLFSLSAAIYAAQIVLFHDRRDTLFYLLQDWAFLPAQIAVVSIVVGQVINAREKQDRLSKTRMLASSFFGDLGNDLLQLLLPCTCDFPQLVPLLQIGSDWKARDFQAASRALRSIDLHLSLTPENFSSLKSLLTDRRLPLLVIASNPALLEHEDFTDMLWAVFHMTDELTARDDLTVLAPDELSHLNADARRVLSSILVNWVCHMDNIRTEYPYLYSLAVRENPFLNRERVSA